MSDMSEFLDVRVGDVKMPEALPTGTYRFVLTRYVLEHANNENKTPYVLVTLKPVDVVDAEDEVALDDAKNVSHKFWRTPKSDRITVRFLTDTLGIKADEDSTLGQLWEQAIGAEVEAAGTQKMGGKNKDVPFFEIERFFKTKAA